MFSHPSNCTVQRSFFHFPAKERSSILLWCCLLLFPVLAIGQDLCDDGPVPPNQEDLRGNDEYTPGACPADDIQILQAYLDTGTACNTCEPGTTVTADLYLRLRNKTNSSNRYIGIFGDLQIVNDGDTTVCDLIRCGGALELASANPDGQAVNFGQVTYTCGSELTLTNILAAFTANNAKSCPVTPANNPNGKYCYNYPDLVINPPLFAEATAACASGSTTDIDLQVSGGSGDYSFAWSNGSTSEDLTNVPLGTYSVTVSDNQRSDSNGQACQVVETITFEGPCCQAPDIVCPADTTITCEASTDTSSLGVPTYTDGCGEVKLSYSDSFIPSCGLAGVITRTWMATDEENPAAVCKQIITVIDTLAPVYTKTPLDTSVLCIDDAPLPENIPAYDACDGLIEGKVHADTIPGACPKELSINRTYTWEDACGNVSMVKQKIIVRDTTAPIVPSPPAPQTVECADDVELAPTLFGRDGCGGLVLGKLSVDTIPGNCPNDFVINRTWTFTNVCGQSSMVKQVVTVKDTTAPVPPAAPAPLLVECADDVTAAPSLSATDACDGQIPGQLTADTIPGSCPNDFVINRTWTFADACGNTSMVKQAITVRDTTAPVPPAAPAPLLVECADDVTAAPSLSATDACDGQVPGQLTADTIPGSCPNDFVINRTWTFADACGNTSMVKQVITVKDTTGPVLNLPADLAALDCTEPTGPANTGYATASDDCYGTATVTYTDKIVDSIGLNCYSIQRTWTAADICGNSSHGVQTIVIVDKVAPTFQDCPANETVSCTDDIPLLVHPSATDNCDSKVEVVYNGEVKEADCDPGFYTLTRSWTATDNCGNTTDCEQVITVRTRLTDPCYSLQQNRTYDPVANTTTFEWELCLIGEECKALSNIRFSIPCTTDKRDVTDFYSSVKGVKSEITGNPRRCAKGYFVTFENFGEDALAYESNQCARFRYTVAGDLRDYEVDAPIKAGNQDGLGFEGIGPNCDCDASDTAAPSFALPMAKDPDTRTQAQIGQVSLFPNPVTDQLTLRFVAKADQPLTVRIFNATGSLQLMREVVTAEGENQLRFELGSLPSGVYRLLLQPQNGGTQTLSFVRLHR